jgi:hypothetical protein
MTADLIESLNVVHRQLVARYVAIDEESQRLAVAVESIEALLRVYGCPRPDEIFEPQGDFEGEKKPGNELGQPAGQPAGQESANSKPDNDLRMTEVVPPRGNEPAATETVKARNPVADWPLARQLWETTSQAMTEICGRVPCTVATLKRHATIEGWAARPFDSEAEEDDEDEEPTPSPQLDRERVAPGDIDPRTGRRRNPGGNGFNARQTDEIVAIARPVWESASPRYGISAIAKAAGVSATTIYRIANDRGWVSSGRLHSSNDRIEAAIVHVLDSTPIRPAPTTASQLPRGSEGDPEEGDDEEIPPAPRAPRRPSMISHRDITTESIRGPRPGTLNGIRRRCADCNSITMTDPCEWCVKRLARERDGEPKLAESLA